MTWSRADEAARSTCHSHVAARSASLMAAAVFAAYAMDAFDSALHPSGDSSSLEVRSAVAVAVVAGAGSMWVAAFGRTRSWWVPASAYLVLGAGAAGIPPPALGLALMGAGFAVSVCLWRLQARLERRGDSR